MDPDGRHVVITGAAGGIGAALAAAFAAAGARLTLSDRPGSGVDAVVARLGASEHAAVEVDIASEAGNIRLIEAARDRHGEIDLFFANAGVAIGRGPESPEQEWETAFAVNLHAHRWAARHLLPDWLARGHGYFCSTASAAGLLSQIGSAPYTLTKHAAVAFAEWLSITYGDRGLSVTCLCPQGVNTAMLRGTGVGDLGSEVVRAAGAVLEPDEVAAVALDAIRAERFLALPHPEVHTYVQRKAADADRWIAGMRVLQTRITGHP
ncbi:MAG: SDR family oxidoreductase [Ilumatobacteraceae bacterium]